MRQILLAAAVLLAPLQAFGQAVFEPHSNTIAAPPLRIIAPASATELTRFDLSAIDGNDIVVRSHQATSINPDLTINTIHQWWGINANEGGAAIDPTKWSSRKAFEVNFPINGKLSVEDHLSEFMPGTAEAAPPHEGVQHRGLSLSYAKDGTYADGFFRLSKLILFDWSEAEQVTWDLDNSQCRLFDGFTFVHHTNGIPIWKQNKADNLSTLNLPYIASDDWVHIDPSTRFGEQVVIVGAVTAGGAITSSGGNVTIPAANSYVWAGRCTLSSPATDAVNIGTVANTARLSVTGAGAMSLTNSAGTAGTGTLTTGFVNAHDATGNTKLQLASNGGVFMGSGMSLNWDSTANVAGTTDLTLVRDAADTLAQRRLANPQTLRIYGTTDAGTANYERIAIIASAGAAKEIIEQAAGTGVATGLRIGTSSATNLTLRTGGTDKWAVTNAGSLLASTDNTYDIGASGASRPRTGYFGTSLIVENAGDNARTFIRPGNSNTAPAISFTSGHTVDYASATNGFGMFYRADGDFQLERKSASTTGVQVLTVARSTGTITLGGHTLYSPDNTYDIGASGATRPRSVYVGTNITAGGNVIAGNAGFIGWTTGSNFQNAGNGIITLLNAAGTDFARLQFGGTTSSFPSIKRNAAAVNFRLADDSADASITCGDAAVSGNLNVTASTLVTIASGAITITKSFHRVGTEASDPSDDLVTISGGTAGDMLVLIADHANRTVVVKDGTGNIQTEGDCSLDNPQDTITLLFDGTNWLETSRSNNGAWLQIRRPRHLLDRESHYFLAA